MFRATHGSNKYYNIAHTLSVFILAITLIGNFNYTQCVNYSIVFIHIGDQLPPYLPDALEQARLFNKKQNIYLIANKKAIQTSTYNFKKQNFTIIFCENLTQCREHKEFLQKSTLNKTYRNGFWLRTTERFFYLYELMVDYNLKHVVHLENDNMLYVDLNDIDTALSHYAGIGAVFDCDTRCIPGFVYITNHKPLKGLVTFIANNALQGNYDMQSLAMYKNIQSKKIIDSLPLIMPAYIHKYPLVNTLHQTTTNPNIYINNIDQFNSIFDGAAIGQYLGGGDPILGTYPPGFINETCLFNPANISFEWKIDAQNRKVPYAVFENIAYRINNLHIHSKNLKPFKSVVAP